MAEICNLSEPGTPELGSPLPFTKVDRREKVPLRIYTAILFGFSPLAVIQERTLAFRKKQL